MKCFRAAREWCPAGLHEAVPFERFGISPSAAGADTFARGTEGSNPSCSRRESIANLNPAVEQLDWAIRLFLDHKAYVPAITLAGAAEEVLGQAVGSSAAFNVLKQKFAADLTMPEKVISQEHLNRAKNWLKHSRSQTDDEKLCLEWEEEAIQYIVRALTNLGNHNGSWPSEGRRFFAWMSENRADYFRD
jgi:hypothetical protein